MFQKRKLAVCASCIMLVGALTVPAMAHGHHGRGYAQTVSYPACTVSDCQLTYNHDHDGVTYCGRAYPACTVSDCQLTYSHDHDGVTYCGHTRGDGHAHHVACSVSGCSVLGEHSHRSRGHCGRHC